MSVRLFPPVLVAAAVALASCATAPGDRAISEVIARESQFSDEAKAIGIVPAFRQFVGPEAIMFLPEPVVINPHLATADWPGELDWRPQHAFASKDGDVVITAGPSMWRTSAGADAGYYFTVWLRQDDGSFRFALDGSAAMTTDLYSLPATGLKTMIADTSSGSEPEPESAFKTVAETAVGPAYLAALADFSLVLRPGQAPHVGRTDVGALPEQPARLIYHQSGRGQSASGDLQWAYGMAEWTDNGDPKRAAYVRAWLLTPRGWRIALDHLASTN